MGRERKVFISYRKDRTAAEAQRVFQVLERSLGADRLVMDVVNGHAGAAASRAFRRSLAETGVMLALIGEKWLERAGPDGGRSKAAPAVMQHAEIASALKANVPVVPVLLGNASKPVASALPVEIAGLARSAPVRLREAEDFAGLQKAVTAALGDASTVSKARAPSAPRKGTSILRVCAALLVAAAICASVYYAAP